VLILADYSPSGDDKLFSFFIDYNGDETTGLDQFVLSESAENDELVFIEKWSMPDAHKEFFTETSVLSGWRLKLNNEYIKANEFPYRKSLSYGKFTNYLSDLIEKDNITLTSELEKFINVQFRTIDTELSANSLVYDISKFTNWVADTSGKNFHPIGYDSFNIYFYENEGYKLTVSNYLKSSTVRDKASLFPWCDLLHGDSGYRARKGDATWNWIRELTICKWFC
jgi:hypothetical protein